MSRLPIDGSGAPLGMRPQRSIRNRRTSSFRTTAAGVGATL